ncbi:hypothetical protein [Variibacter gotjawalensis]|uniref:hypothetical protein n=1 Tax=Variibacter gotjawalensis TaxID=1333996 RepID=UPI00102C8C1C|nr:hypothetical protein [Variibacter gotjawalensis]NIK49334.1 hypothetical protein [Variibacter gotjawalensis]
MYLTLRSVDDALVFVHRYLMQERSGQLDGIRTERLLQLASVSPTRGVRQAATIALRDLLRAENMLG